MFVIEKLPILAKEKENENIAYFKKLKKRKRQDLDKIMQEIHTEVFENIDCLECANCCRGLGPRLNDHDISRLASHLKIKPAELASRFLKIDEDNDFIFNSMPCPFLCADNYCAVYNSRPKACREYPHLDRKRFEQITEITIKNTAVCPAAYQAVELLKKRLPL